MLVKEYRIPMPLSVEEYRIGQLYMIAKHSHEQSDKGEGVEVVKNEACDHPEHGKGQFTEKRIHLSSRLPTWIQAVIPNLFYITEKAWNFYPYTTTEYTCSFIPRFSIQIETRYENNNGSTENCLGLNPEELLEREVVPLDIAFDAFPEKHYKEEEDPTTFKSKKTGRGPLEANWKDTSEPIMCSYKLVRAKFEVWGLQTKTESYTHSAVRDVLLAGHRQAFAWIDEWFGMTLEELRQYEDRMHQDTNRKFGVEVEEPVCTQPHTPNNTPTDNQDGPVETSGAPDKPTSNSTADPTSQSAADS